MKQTQVNNRPFVFLDIDDTLLDFHKAEAIALARALREMDVEPKPETLERYSAINKAQWELLEESLLTRQQVLLRRFEILYQELGLERPADRTRDLYEGYLAIGHYFMPGANELLKALKDRYRLFIVSNGTSSVQASRIASAGIGSCFERIFISEEIGYEKPEKSFFEACFTQIPGFDRRQAIIVGDSLTSDIRGGLNAGILTCWFNPKGKPPKADIVPHYTVRELAEVPGLLERLFETADGQGEGV